MRPPINLSTLRSARITTVIAFFWWTFGVASFARMYPEWLTIAG